MAPAAAASAMTKITLSFMLSLLGDKNFQGPDAPVNSKYHWAYKGPEGPQNWHMHYKYCAGEHQSPIDILTSRGAYDPGLDPIVLDQFDTPSGHTGPCVLNVTNNGHAASVRVLNQAMRVMGGGLGQTYKTVEFHFHWGSTDEIGSEHALNGRKFPLEMHVVNFAESYGNVKLAMTQPGGLAVLGVFFEIAENDNPHFAAVEEAIRRIHKAGDHSTINLLRLRSLLPDDLSKYWRYNGSLTTPFCFESVIWTVFAQPQKISKAQLESLRSLLHEEGHDISDRGEHRSFAPSRLVDNWRPLQPLNGRVVKQSFTGEWFPTKAFQDPRMPSYEVSGNSGGEEVSASNVFLNVNPTFMPLTSPADTSEKVMTPGRVNIPSDIAPVISFNSHQTLGRGPMEEKLLIYNQGSSGAVGVNSRLAGVNSGTIGANSGSVGVNSASSAASSPEKSRQGELVADVVMADDAATSLFGQIQQSSQASSAAEGPSIRQQNPTLSVDQASSSTTLQASRLHKEVMSSGPGTHASSVGTNKVYSNGRGQQGSNPGIVTSGPSEKMPVSTSSFRSTNRPSLVQDSSAHSRVLVSLPPQAPPQPSIQASSMSQSRNHNQHNQTSQSRNDNQRQESTAQSQSSIGHGQMDSRIARLANNIRSHRHGLTQTLQQTRSGSNTQPVINVNNNNNRGMPPVIRHQQAQTLSQANNNLISQQRRHSLLQQQRQEILNMKQPPTPQQLRAIFEKLAASSRAKSRPTPIISGAAAIPYVKANYANSVRYPTQSQTPHSSRSPTNRNAGNQRVTFANDHSHQRVPSSTAASPSPKSWAQPVGSPVHAHEGTASYSSPQLYWSQPASPQTYPQEIGYQSYTPLQASAYPQDPYPHQPPSQQYSYYQTDPAFMYSTATANTNTGHYYGASPAVLTSNPNFMLVPQLAATDTSMQPAYLHNQQQPVRILRPVYEQAQSWQPAQYQTQQYPLFVY